MKRRAGPARPVRRPRTHIFEVLVQHCPKTPGPYKYAVEVPSLPGCVSDGRTRVEALRNIRDAIALFLAARRSTSKQRDLVEVTL